MKWSTIVAASVMLCICVGAEARQKVSYTAHVVSSSIGHQGDLSFKIIFKNLGSNAIYFSGENSTNCFELVQPYFVIQKQDGKKWDDIITSIGSYLEPSKKKTVGADENFVFLIRISRNFVESGNTYRFNFCGTGHSCIYYSSTFRVSASYTLIKM